MPFMIKTNYLPLALLFLCCAINLTAQKLTAPAPKTEILNFADTVRNFERVTELGVLMGGMLYFGDLSDDQFDGLQEVNFINAGIFVRRHLWPNIALRGNFSTGTLSSVDQPYPERNYNFTNRVSALSIQAEWDVFGKRRYRRVDTLTYVMDNYTQHALVNVFRHNLLPYGFVGIGVIRSKAHTNFKYPDDGIQTPEMLEDKRIGSQLSIKKVVLLGGGLNLDLGRRWLLGAEVGANTSFDDYIDGVSLTGNPKMYDIFLTGSVNLSYRIGVRDRDGDGTPDSKDKCPETPGMGRTKGCPDADNDGISDKEDECPRVAGVLWLAGCPVKDFDQDGVPDVDDECEKVAGLLQFKGCPDTDSDGIEDRQDSCITVAGLVQFHGCPDTDEDGIEDKKDACPKEKGIEEYYYGCPVRDTDGDGVEDRYDRCLIVAGKPGLGGCPDKDNDEVEDALDLCPGTAGTKENKGCPVIEQKDAEKLKVAVKAVKFETGKAVLKPESNKVLNEIALILNKYPDYSLKIDGHTDNVGKVEKNQALSEQRAKICATYIGQKGVAANRIQSKGFGSSKPIADNKTATGKAENRRVEFTPYLPEKN
jgi:outer membrane protein OmpA-like peptidoglycan-associated protein